jgi:hypothetical protein
MAGCPIRRAGETTTRKASGNGNGHPRAGLPVVAWRRLSPGEKLERLFGSLSTMADILSWTAGDLDPARLNVQASLARMVLMIGARAGLLDDRATTARGWSGSKS